MRVEEVDQREYLPYPIGMQRIVCFGDYGLYLTGVATYVGSKSISNQLYDPQMCKFNISTGKWTKMSPVEVYLDDPNLSDMRSKPEKGTVALASRSMISIDRRHLLIVGGRLVSRRFDVASCSAYLYNVESQTTSVLTSAGSDQDTQAQLPCGHRDLFDQTLLKWHQSYILCSRVLDERRGKKRFLFHLLDINVDDKTVKWEEVSPVDGDEPSSGDLCELAIYRDHIYCIDKNDDESCLDVQWRYGLRARRWERVESTVECPTDPPYQPLGQSRFNFSFGSAKPADRIFTSRVSYGEYVYIVGGSAMDWTRPKANPACSDIWRFHLPTLQWSLMPVKLPEGVWFHSADVSPSGCMYVYGGFTDVAGTKMSQKIYRVYLNEAPSLSSLAWKTVLKWGGYQLEEKDEQELRDLRVPPCFVHALKW